MEAIEKLTQLNYILIFLGFFAILFGIKEIIEICLYFKKRFRIKFGREEDKEIIEDRILVLEKHDNWQYKEISKMSKGIDDIKCQLTEKERADKERTVATLRNQLYGLHTKFSEKGYVDNSGLKTFTELGKIYEAAGGDDIYHEKLKPEVLALPIHDD
jgi:hypothetical protein|nr:MAG TPA: hypothetical protein [Bacteriophage sp.]